MAETISGALSDLGRTFRRMQEGRAAAEDRRLRQEQIVSNERLALEGLQLQGERDVATAALQQAQSEANIRQGERRLDLQQQQADVNELQGQQRLDILGRQTDIQKKKAETQQQNIESQIADRNARLKQFEEMAILDRRIKVAQAEGAEITLEDQKLQQGNNNRLIDFAELGQGFKQRMLDNGVDPAAVERGVAIYGAAIDALGFTAGEPVRFKDGMTALNAVLPLVQTLNKGIPDQMTNDQKLEHFQAQWDKFDIETKDSFPKEKYIAASMSISNNFQGHVEIMRQVDEAMPGLRERARQLMPNATDSEREKFVKAAADAVRVPLMLSNAGLGREPSSELREEPPPPASSFSLESIRTDPATLKARQEREKRLAEQPRGSEPSSLQILRGAGVTTRPGRPVFSETLRQPVLDVDVRQR